ncbi:cAMP and cAMP-inhibited cGMP 3',5'-cyclic phosphodiesterase 10A-like, partial [Anneissia japonica]|uniref:cAMP and cAMP-inhibited cGMP 3',5'-cyclic phosphodiesterase 10A-like n=1 Tax=Anneissia japonica TaxID=1529436 RepID=UPI0014255F6C
MSCPWRQVSFRRLPAFPGNSSVISHYGSAGTQRKRYTNPGQCSVPELREDSLRPETVKEYLLTHQWIVKEYVEEKVSAEEVEEWLKKKQPFNTGECLKEDNFNTISSDMKMFSGDGSTNSIEDVMLSMVADIEDNTGLPKLLNSVAKLISKVCNADVFTLYLVSPMGNDLLFCKEDKEGKIEQIMIGPITYGQTISSYVAFSKELIMESDILGDERFPMGTGIDNGQANSLLVLPILLPNGDIHGVIELSRNEKSKPFNEENKQVACMYLTWVGIAIHKIQ